MLNYEIVFSSENIHYINLNELLVDDYLNMVNDYENVGRFISHKPKNYTHEEELKWLKEKQKEKALCFSMIEKSTNEFIGNIEIMEINDGIGTIGISITALKQNKHYGQEAIKSFMSYTHKTLGIKGFDLTVYAENERAIKCYKNLGFIEDQLGKSDLKGHSYIHMTYEGQL